MLPRLRSGLAAALSGLAALAVLAMPSGALASRLPEPVLAGNYSLDRVGAGDLSWLGRPIYQASLWTFDGRFDGFESGRPVALSLWYQRDFSRAELLRITSTAWRLLGDQPAERRSGWLEALGGIWSDVGPGDNMTTVVVPGQPTRFYDQKGFRGQIDDPEFGPAFLSIWLDSRSVVGDLRVRLLGLDQGVARR
jgi:hypothetical protein